VHFLNDLPTHTTVLCVYTELAGAPVCMCVCVLVLVAFVLVGPSMCVHMYMLCAYGLMCICCVSAEISDHLREDIPDLDMELSSASSAHLNGKELPAVPQNSVQTHPR